MQLLVFTVVAVVFCGAFAEKDPAFKKFRDDFGKMLKEQHPEVLKVASIPQAESAKIYYKIVKKFLLDRGAKASDAEEVAKTKSESIAKNYDKITPDNKSYLVGLAIASGLEKIGKLNENNAAELASEAVQDFDNVISNKDTSTDEAKALSIFEGYDKFLDRFGESYVKLSDVMNKAVVDYINAA